jgi:hypothetical protein
MYLKVVDKVSSPYNIHVIFRTKIIIFNLYELETLVLFILFSTVAFLSSFSLSSFLPFFLPFFLSFYSDISKVNQQYVSTFLTAGNIKFLLLHSGKSEDTIKIFFQEVHELYVQLSMNPFYRYDTPITSKEFDKRVRNVARRLV